VTQCDLLPVSRIPFDGLSICHVIALHFIYLHLTLLRPLRPRRTFPPSPSVRHAIYPCRSDAGLPVARQRYSDIRRTSHAWAQARHSSVPPREQTSRCTDWLGVEFMCYCLFRFGTLQYSGLFCVVWTVNCGAREQKAWLRHGGNRMARNYCWPKLLMLAGWLEEYPDVSDTESWRHEPSPSKWMENDSELPGHHLYPRSLQGPTTRLRWHIVHVGSRLYQKSRCHPEKHDIAGSINSNKNKLLHRW